MNNIIKHQGVIESIEGNHVKVRIMQTSACSACKASNHCSVPDSREKVIGINTNASSWTTGEEVVVSISHRTAAHALFLGFGLPVLLLITTLTVAKLCTDSDSVAALLSLGLLSLYYIIVWGFNEKIAHRITFQIEKKQTAKINN